MIAKKSQIGDELVLIEKSIKGQGDAQKELYLRYAPAMLNVAYRICGNKEDAKDILQDAFIKIFSHLKKLKNKQGLAAWIKRIVVNTAITAVKKKDRQFIELKEVGKEIEWEDTIEATPIYNLKDVKKALMQLPNGYRTVLTLYLIEGYDHQEISEILGIAKSTSLTQYNRGKKKLIRLLRNNMEYGAD